MFDSGRSYFLGRSHIRLAPFNVLHNEKNKVLVSSQFRYRNTIFKTLAIAYIGNY